MLDRCCELNQTRIMFQACKKRKNAGFTLIEIMVVIAILGILASLGVGSYFSSQKKSRDSRRKADLRNVATALETYFNDFNGYPDDDGSGGMEGCGAGGAELCVWGDAFSDTTSGVVYMPKLPEDPVSGYSFYYDVGAQNASYQLYVRLENTEDSVVQDSGGNPIIYQGLSCGTLTCNYGIASSNTTPETGRTIVQE